MRVDRGNHNIGTLGGGICCGRRLLQAVLGLLTRTFAMAAEMGGGSTQLQGSSRFCIKARTGHSLTCPLDPFSFFMFELFARRRSTSSILTGAAVAPRLTFCVLIFCCFVAWGRTEPPRGGKREGRRAFRKEDQDRK